MRAGVLHAPHDVRIEDRPEPVPGGQDVVIEVAYNGLCGTDATEYGKGPMMVPLSAPHPGSGHVGPTILGHEFIGTVVDAGPAARSWVGKQVAWQNLLTGVEGSVLDDTGEGKASVIGAILTNRRLLVVSATIQVLAAYSIGSREPSCTSLLWMGPALLFTNSANQVSLLSLT